VLIALHECHDDTLLNSSHPVLTMLDLPPQGVLCYIELANKGQQAYLKEIGILREDESNLLQIDRGAFALSSLVGARAKRIVGIRVGPEEAAAYKAYCMSHGHLLPDDFPDFQDAGGND